MDEFLVPVNLLLSALGFPVLQPARRCDPSAVDVDRPTALRRGLRRSNASRVVEKTGASRDDGFVVYAGSLGSAEVREHLAKGSTTIREHLASEGVLRMVGGRMLMTKTVQFTSPSAAAAIFAGSASNRRDARKRATGITLKELEGATLAIASGTDPA